MIQLRSEPRAISLGSPEPRIPLENPGEKARGNNFADG